MEVKDENSKTDGLVGGDDLRIIRHQLCWPKILIPRNSRWYFLR